MVNSSILKTISFKYLSKWDVKSNYIRPIKSLFPVLPLAELLDEQNEKRKLSNYPEEEFGILGIKNDGGMFDAYIEKGKNIKQPYKYVKNDFIAYNPYRINVGSIGIKKKILKNEYISNAYIVFTTKKLLLADFVYLIMKTKRFNAFIRDNTTGSVRQTLSFNNLCNISIPVPSLLEQKLLVQKYNQTIFQANNLEEKAKKAEEELDKYILQVLGIQEISMKIKREILLRSSMFSNMYNWDANHAVLNRGSRDILRSKLYKSIPITEAFIVNPSTYIPKETGEISFLPMECISDIYGDIIEKRIINSAAKGYTKFKDNDVIFAKISPCMQNGKCAVVKDLKNGFGMGSTEFYVFRSVSEEANPEFLHVLLRTRLFRKTALNYFTGSSGQQRVSIEFIKNLFIPLPPLEVQNEIVLHINKRKDEIKKLHNQAKVLRNQAEQNFEKNIFEN